MSRYKYGDVHEFQLDPERVAYKEREKKHGVKVSRRVVIEVDLDAPEIVAEEAVVEEEMLVGVIDVESDKPIILVIKIAIASE